MLLLLAPFAPLAPLAPLAPPIRPLICRASVIHRAGVVRAAHTHTPARRHGSLVVKGATMCAQAFATGADGATATAERPRRSSSHCDERPQAKYARPRVPDVPDVPDVRVRPGGGGSETALSTCQAASSLAASDLARSSVAAEARAWHGSESCGCCGGCRGDWCGDCCGGGEHETSRAS